MLYNYGKRLAIFLLAIVLSTLCNTVKGQIGYEEAFPNISFNFPVEIQNASDGSNRIFVVEQPGRIKVFSNNEDVSNVEVTTFLDVTSKVSYSSGQEIGLLGLAFHPDFDTNGFFYVYYIDRPSNYRVNIVRYKVSSNNPNVADTSSETLILSTLKNQSDSNHNGGKIAFGPNGYLYASVGDGGGAGDPNRNAQNLNNAFGSILRIDVDLDGNNPVSSSGSYEIPSDNPRVGQSGLDEIYAWGIRNTWKFSFDGNTLYAADVGQGSYEEINIIENGKNYGWNRFEGDNTYNSSVSLITSPDTKPIYTYNRSLGVSVTGGYVYRGAMTNSSLTGKYIYGDYATGRIWALDYNTSNGQVSNEFLFKTSGQFISSFGLDEAGEIYFSNYGSSAKIYKITDQDSGPVEVNVNGVGDFLNAGVNGVNGNIESIVNDGSNVFYIGGEFSDASGVAANNLAKYSKANGWEAMGTGTNGKVNAVAVANNGDVYVGGNFTQIDGVAANNIAFWNGTNWSALTSGTDGPVAKIGIDSNDNIYVGGSYITAGGITVNNIALWNGTWNALTDGTTAQTGTNNEIRSIAFDETNTLYIGGNFDTAGGNSANRIATWNGTNWGTLGDGTSGFVQAIVATTDYIYAGGNFAIAGNTTVNRIARWNRNALSWEALNNGLSGNTNSMAFDGNHLYVGGAFTTASDETNVNEVMNNIARWSDTDGWEALGPNTDVGVNTLINTLAFSSDNSELMLGGNFTNAGATNVSNIAFWGESNNCSNRQITPSYTVNGTNNSGANSLSVFEGASFELGTTESLFFTVQLPDGSEEAGPISIAAIDFDDEGTYTITTTEGCTATFAITVTEDPNGDQDNDNVINSNDLCPNTPNGESVDADGCGESQKDDDNDGVFNNLDLCPSTPNGESVDIDGCGESQKDDDNDGVFNTEDLCPNTPNGESVDVDGCAESQKDDDSDGVFNTEDLCPNTPAEDTADVNGCGESQLDDDNDGVFNNVDICPDTPTNETADSLGCGPSQQDIDNDGVLNFDDLCNGTPAGETVDGDGCAQSQLDDDNDGVFNTEDLCPNTPNGESVDSDGCGQSQLDDDNDGVFNSEDLCPGTANGATVDSEGCSEPQRDDDNDGVINADDLCPGTPNGESVDANGCGQSQLDDDNDGVFNSEDLCPDTTNGATVDLDGCSEPQRDDDNDGVINADDLCPGTPNGESVDTFGCGQSQLDDDNDGVMNGEDQCSDTPDGESVDANGCGQSQLDDDSDGVFNTEDTCPNTPNGETVDVNGCGQSQLDDDNDGVFNSNDLCPNTPNGETVDTNGCGQSQLDDDNDGVLNGEDTCPNTPNGDSVDTNGCGQSQLDDDNDGVFNDIDICPNTPSGESVNATGCGQSQIDDDNDGVFNSNDLCPNTPNGELTNLSGCSDSQLDDDDDGVFNDIDICPNTPSGQSVDSDGCGTSQQDIDNDGVPNSEDLCNDTPNGESVNLDGCSESQLDDDNDGVSNANDLCPGTPAGVSVDFEGCELPPDDDGDGVINTNDSCPNTPAGTLVDQDGCEIFSLSPTNFTISSTGISCIGVFDGKITIQAERPLNYSLQLRAVSFAVSQNFTEGITLDNLPAGAFELCITVNGVEDYESCSTVVVDAPTSLSVFSEIIKESSSLKISMQGGEEYLIDFNGTTFTTSSSEIELKLTQEENILKITTNKSCQGAFEATYLLDSSLKVYPNPFKNAFTVVRSSPASEDSIAIKFYDISGRVLFTEEMKGTETQKEFDTSSMPQGVYLVEIFENRTRRLVKLIKQ